MKWFKHDGNARDDEKIEKLLMKYGVEGYGLYFYCVEIIAGNLSGENITFELKHDAETIAYRLRMDTLKVEEIMKFCVESKLFEYNHATNRISCLKLGRRLDISTSNNPEIRKIVSNYQKLLESNSRLDKNRLDKKRKEETRLDNTSEPAGKPATWTELHKSIEESCLSQISDSSQYQYSKERAHVKKLADKFDKHEEPYVFANTFFEAFHRLKNGRDKFWREQPFLPSVLNSGGIYPRIVEAMKEPEYTQTGAEVTF